jgi:hypothetical protein
VIHPDPTIPCLKKTVLFPREIFRRSDATIGDLAGGDIQIYRAHREPSSINDRFRCVVFYIAACLVNGFVG